jgi:hypothetical protein
MSTPSETASPPGSDSETVSQSDSEPATETGRETQASGRTLVIPSSVTALTPDYFRGASDVESILFEPPSQIRCFEPGTFRYCTALKSICIPPSVQVLCSRCFCDPQKEATVSDLVAISFEPDSRLHTIQNHAFYGCFSLASLCLPASVRHLTGASFWRCTVGQVTIDPGNRHFRITGSFISDFDNRLLVRYFGTERVIHIPDAIEAIDQCCFADCAWASTIAFGAMSKLRWIGNFAFYDCPDLTSISFPSSLTSIGLYCCADCRSLSMVTFCANSHLRILAGAAFDSCTELISIDLPSSLEVIERSAFANCVNLSTVAFAPDSKLVRIGPFAFERCSSLTSLFVPSSVEFVDCLAFDCDYSLSDLRFGTPCKVRELHHLPPRWTGLRDVPDCVEMLGLAPDLDRQCHCALMFGRESKLCHIDASPAPVPEVSSPPCRTFLQGSTPSLKRFRGTLEFGSFLSRRTH